MLNMWTLLSAQKINRTLCKPSTNALSAPLRHFIIPLDKSPKPARIPLWGLKINELYESY